MVCASSIFNRTEGHFKVVLAFEGKWERQIRKKPGGFSFFFLIHLGDKKADRLLCVWDDNEAFKQTYTRQSEDTLGFYLTFIASELKY